MSRPTAIVPIKKRPAYRRRQVFQTDADPFSTIQTSYTETMHKKLDGITRARIFDIGDRECLRIHRALVPGTRMEGEMTVHGRGM